MKVLIVQWIIMNCDKETFIGMRWENRAKGIFWLYWKHQSSRSCREISAEAAALYEYYRAWARHKNRIDGKKKPRDLKAAFRNALEKKQELERLTALDTKERIYWRIKNFPYDQKETCASSPPSSKFQKPKGRRGRKPSKNLSQNSSEFPINFGASTSTASDDVTSGRKKSRKVPIKGTRKVSCKSKRSFADEQFVSSSCDPTVNGFSIGQEEAKNQPPLPPFQFIRRNEHDTGSWENSVENTNSTFSPQPPQFSQTSYDKSKADDVWTPQMLTQFTPPRLSSDLMEVSSTEFMDLLVPSQRIDYSFQPTPPQETTDILFDNITDADLMTLGKIINGGESSILKYSFPFQPEEVPTSPHLTNMHTQRAPATSLHCCPSDFVSMTNISIIQNNDCVLNSSVAPVNAFCFDQNQGSYDQIVPPYCEAFQTSSQSIDTSDTFVNDCLLYSPQSMDNHGKIPKEMCHQQADTECHSVEMCRYSDQTSHDDSGISDMEDFLDCANKLLDDIEFQYDVQRHQMC
ncbi:uncharacterized protein LOC129963402 [Argiope bruennichi]|uniref:uncharacterized protein LOC129963402 n=1 Tax=Argiope bruennichi TaxID=94029 RepID=UPI0024940907|nr:uncharacterized protein LOC129963402 [Argiope bruennichi]